MITSSYFNRLMEILPTEMRLVRRAKSGNVGAFVELCDPFIRHVYRYIHFLAPTNRIAEALTVQVFFKAWERLDQYQIMDMSLQTWLFTIARKQVEDHARTHRGEVTPDNIISLAARGSEFKAEYQSIREAIRSLPMDQQQALVLKLIVGMDEKDIAHFMGMSKHNIRALQVDALCAITGHLAMRDTITLTDDSRRLLEHSLAEISTNASSLDTSLLRHFKSAPQLEPILKTALLLQLGRDVKPASTFNSYTHDALVQYLHSRPRRTALVSSPMVRRTAMAFSIVMAALLVTGTAHAQAALPGEPFYGWKRASENIWHALTPNSVTTDIALVERRLDEWVAVANNPFLRDSAMHEYQVALAELKSSAHEDDLDEVLTALEAQQYELALAGLNSPELNEYLIQVSVPAAVDVTLPEAAVVVFVTLTPNVTDPESGMAVIPPNECAPDCVSNKDKDKIIPAGQNGRVDKPSANDNENNGNPGSNNAGGNNSGNNAGGNNNNNNAGGNGNNDGNNAGGNDNDNNAGGNGNDNGGGNDK